MHRFLLVIIVVLMFSCSKNSNKNTVKKIKGANTTNAVAGDSTIKQGDPNVLDNDKQDDPDGSEEKDSLNGKDDPNADPEPENDEDGGSEQLELSVANGIKLYAQFCESCHNKIAVSAKVGATPDRIRQGLQVPQMSSIKLSEAQIVDISNALKNIADNNDDMGVTARSNYTEWSAYNKNQIDAWINADMQNANVTTRYIYLDQDIYQHPTNRNMARVCLSKALNSVSLSNPGLIHPRDVSDNHGVVFAVDLNDHFRDLAGLRENRGVGNFRKPNLPENYQPEIIWTKLLAKAEEKNIQISALIQNMFRPNSYKYLMDHPLSDKKTNFEYLGIADKDPKIKMAIEDAIIYGIRYLEAYEYEAKANDGKTYKRQYWRSGDPVYGVDASTEEGLARFNGQCGATDVPVFDNSIVRTLTWDEEGGIIPPMNGGSLPRFLDNCTGGLNATGSESWRTLPNGLIVYYLWGVANSIELGGATSLIYNPIHRATDKMNLPLGECFYCHNTGTMYRTSDMATAKAQGKLSNQDAFDFWSDQNEIDKFYKESSQLYDQAILEIVSSMSDDLDLNKKLLGYQTQEPCFITSGYKFGTLPNGEPDNTPGDKK